MKNMPHDSRDLAIRALHWVEWIVLILLAGTTVLAIGQKLPGVDQLKWRSELESAAAAHPAESPGAMLENRRDGTIRSRR